MPANSPATFGPEQDALRGRAFRDAVIPTANAEDDAIHAGVAVLLHIDEAKRARLWLRHNGWDINRRHLERARFFLRTRSRLHSEPAKSWDVAMFARRLHRQLRPDARIVDVGGVMSELPWVMHLAGHSKIISCDLDPRVLSMPYGGAIDYRVGAPQDLRLASGSVGAITAVSTIEHGVHLQEFLEWASVALAPGGLLCVSTDYWPDKISTAGLGGVGLSWTVFSEQEIHDLIGWAKDVGLEIPGWDGRVPSAAEPPVSWNHKQYTFIALTFVKRTP